MALASLNALGSRPADPSLLLATSNGARFGGSCNAEGKNGSRGRNHNELSPVPYFWPHGQSELTEAYAAGRSRAIARPASPIGAPLPSLRGHTPRIGGAENC